ncbi:helix-hairpin-helix domain-containing protein [Nocardioides sp. LHD-245]|uniref:helix-hairpin-helix domain-containing protein n=1 Tax=Nocardioides sp. LHD-245 TaxID=3051387 RepID=UPI0027DF47DD|nr:helix-hairpin-helix domain-containing protein [Nocardioides sp. LHD-245]
MPVRRPAARPDPPGADAAARRLALIAADLGAGRSTAASRTVGEATSEEATPGTVGSAVGDAAEPWWADHTRVVARVPADGARSAGVAVPEGSGPGGSGPGGSGPGGSGPGAAMQEGAPALPVPGRHAARRRRGRPSPPAGLLPRAVRLPALGMPQVAVVAIAVALGLAVTTWWVLRDRPAPLEPVSAEPAAPLVTARAPVGGASPPLADGTESAQATSTVTVDVAGKVRRPGIVVLDAGARVTDAVAAAGGARKGVDLTPLNLARVLVDGEQVLVGAPAATLSSGAAAIPGASGGGAPGPLVNLNTAAQAELESLPQVGPVTAQAIIVWRASRGGFTSVDELLEVDGIGDKTLAQIAPHVTV